VSLNDYRRTTFFRTDELDTNYSAGPFVSGFVEYRPRANQTLTLRADDLSDIGGARDLVIFVPDRRAGEPSFLEHRFRNSHIRLGLTFKQSFGGGGGTKVAKAQ
jgi:hypothetical protein